MRKKLWCYLLAFCMVLGLMPMDSVKVFSQKQIWPFGSRQSTGYDIRQQIILCF